MNNASLRMFVATTATLIFISPSAMGEDAIPKISYTKPQDSMVVKSDGPEMVRIPGGNYEIGKYEVTQAEWRAVMGENPPKLKYSSCGNTCPVENISWDDAQEFIKKLNAMTGKDYRLPRKSEWQYACYGGKDTEYCGGDDFEEVGWLGYVNGKNMPHPVGQKKANGYGLYDMSGNVWEWTNDCWNAMCNKRGMCGGSFDYQRAQNAYCDGIEPTWHNRDIGFRLARTLL